MWLLWLLEVVTILITIPSPTYCEAHDHLDQKFIKGNYVELDDLFQKQQTPIIENELTKKLQEDAGKVSVTSFILLRSLHLTSRSIWSSLMALVFSW